MLFGRCGKWWAGEHKAGKTSLSFPLITCGCTFYSSLCLYLSDLSNFAITACPVHLAATSSVLTSHNLASASNCLPFGDSAVFHTTASFLSPCQSLPICTPLSRFYSRTEPPNALVMMRRPSCRCSTPVTQSVCPRLVWRGFILDARCILEESEGSIVGVGCLNYV